MDLGLEPLTRPEPAELSTLFLEDSTGSEPEPSRSRTCPASVLHSGSVGPGPGGSDPV